MKVLIPDRQGKECVKYRIHDNVQELGDTAGALVVPEDKSVQQFLDIAFPNRHNYKDPDPTTPRYRDDWVTVFNHFNLVADNNTTLERLMLAVQAHGTIIVTGDYHEAKKLPVKAGFGEGFGVNVHAFCNGLIFEYDAESSGYIVTYDPKRAKRVLTTQARRKLMPPKAKPRKLQMHDLVSYGRAMMQYLWDKMDLELVKESCLAGRPWRSFQAKDWEMTLGSLRQLRRFAQRNRVSIFTKGFRRALIDHIPEVVDVKSLKLSPDNNWLDRTIGLLAERIAELKKKGMDHKLGIVADLTVLRRELLRVRKIRVKWNKRRNGRCRS